MTVLHPRDPVPLYYQLELLIRDQIESGQLRAGALLPGENLLADQFKVSRITVRRALDRLEEDGVVIRRRGARTIIASTALAPASSSQQKVQRPPAVFRGFEDELRRVGLHVKAALLETTQGTAPPRIAALLEIPEGETVVRIRRLGSSAGSPLWFETRYFPLNIGQKLLAADPSSDSILMLLEEKLELHVEEVRAQLQAVVATPRQAQLLGVDPGTPLFRHQSVTVAADHKPAQVLLAHLRGDLYRLDLQGVPRTGSSGLELVGGGYVVDDRLLDLD